MAHKPDRNTAAIVSETAIFCLVMFLSLVGNLLVCYAVYKNPRLRCPSNYYIISLAFSDIFQALYTMPLSIVMLATGVWPFGTSACYFFAICKYSLERISINTMVLMALNRYYKIVKPAKYQTIFKKGFIILTTSLAWILGILFSLFMIFVLGFGVRPNPDFAICAIQYHRLFALPVLRVVMSLPFLIIIFCYWKIYSVVKMHSANVSWQSSNVEDVKISKTLFVTVVTFVGLWMPAYSIYLASILFPSSFPRQLKLLEIFLVFSSSCVNPFIYGFMNRSFKNEFKKCLKLRRTQTIGTESS